MIKRANAFYFIAFIFLSVKVYSQSPAKNELTLIVLNEKSQPADGASVKQISAGKLAGAAVVNAKGAVRFENIKSGDYTFSITYTGYKAYTTRNYHFPGKINIDTIKLQSATTALQEVSIVAKTPPIEHTQGKTILNVEASVSNVGSTVLEVLEKSPGVTVDKNGGITMQGKTGVQVMIDDKPTYLSGDDLSNLLSSMSSSQVSQIELITNPTAKYDASGNGGIINIKTKKNKQQGFNGTFTATAGMGKYPKQSDGIVLNYRTGKINTFLNYNLTYVKSLMDLYALRKYYDAGNNLTSILDQPGHSTNTSINNVVKTGLDYYITPKTTIGMAVSGTIVHRTGTNNEIATWENPSAVADSSIYTTSTSNNQLKNGSINFNARHNISATKDIAADVDLLYYNTHNIQGYHNLLLTPGGYDEQTRGEIPTTINITSAKVDYTSKFGKEGTFQAGGKLSYSSTDNLVGYQNYIGSQWIEDAARTNHFVYNENIHALYSTIENKYKNISYQLGLRYEFTNYNGRQFGNSLQKDSAFAKNYGGFFPSGYLTYQANADNGFTITVGRRIDRPPFQKLNPFYTIVNKYTYFTGNPYILPQYTWNFEVSHQYKSWLTTAVSYSNISNYFSQIFVNGATPQIILYNQGNVGRVNNIGVSSTIVAAPLDWWSFTFNALYNYKQLKGFNGNTFTTSVNQLNINLNNQFTFAKIYAAELSGFYLTRRRIDLQEILYPNKEVSVGISRPMLNKKATLKLSARDIFYTNAIEGLSQFPNSTEYFFLKRDTRVLTLAFTYRFGKAYKSIKHTNGAADEMQRVGNGS